MTLGPVRSGFGVLLGVALGPIRSGVESCYEWLLVLSGVVLGSCKEWFWGPCRSGFGVLLGMVVRAC